MSGDSDAEGQWVTYGELAAARGIDRQSAAKLAFRRHWRRQKDNHGTVRVCVPPDWLHPERDTSGDASGNMSRDISVVIKPLEAAISVLKEQLDRSEAGREAADRRGDAADRRGDAAEARANRAEAKADDERSRSDALRDQLEAAHAALHQAEATAEQARAQAAAAQEAAEELRQAEAARRARSPIARFRAAFGRR